MIPVEIIDGDYNGFFSVFIEDRAKRIFEFIEKDIINKENEIKKIYYKEKKKPIGNSIDIFAKYDKKIITAKFNREIQELFLDGINYKSVSAAADVAKKKISGKDTSTNGWTFWKYKDGDEDKFIKDLRY